MFRVSVSGREDRCVKYVHIRVQLVGAVFFVNTNPNLSQRFSYPVS